jgi:hypothetical protein
MGVLGWAAKRFAEVTGGNYDTGKEDKKEDDGIEELKKRLMEDNPKTLGEYYKSKTRR